MTVSDRTADRSARHQWFLVLGFFLLAVIYYAWSWSNELGEFGGDNAIYVLTARYFSPWSGHSEVAAYFAKYSQYPPLFPLMLAIIGGGVNLLIAHLFTVTCLLLALIVFYHWLAELDFSALHASMTTLLVAMLPGTYMEVLSIHSENLYLLFTLFALLALTLGEKTGRSTWYLLGASGVAAATLTRGAGISLIAAFTVYLALRRPPRTLLYAVISVFPMVIWHFLHGNVGPSYFDSFIDKYSGFSFDMLISHVGTELHAIWYGWIGNFSISPVGHYVMGAGGIICLCGVVYRVYLRKLDGFYTAAYLLLILAWPFPAEAQRFVFVIIPVLLAQGLLFLVTFPGEKRLHRSFDYRTIMIISIFLIALPALVINANRFLQRPPDNLASYRHAPGWYMLNPREALNNVVFDNAIATHLSQIKNLVPVGSCVYSIKPSIVAYYADRISIVPPQENLDDAAFKKSLRESGCRYFYLMGFSSPSFSKPYYPAGRMQESLKVLHAIGLAGDDNTPVGVLAEFVGQ